MRNEAHRFGITHHRNKRSKAALTSEITQIKGVGRKTHEDLMKAFKTVSGIQDASEEELIKVVGKARARVIRTYFS